MKRTVRCLLTGIMLLALGCSSSGKQQEPVDVGLTYSAGDLAKLQKGEPAVLDAWARPFLHENRRRPRRRRPNECQHLTG